MPPRWRRKYTALFDNVLESGLSDAQLATLARLQAVLHRAWRTDPQRYAAWSDGDAEKTLTLSELHEVTGVASPHKARAKLLALAGCDAYGTGALEIAISTSPRFTSTRSGRGRGSHADAQTARIRWPKFSEVLNLRSPKWNAAEGTARPYEGRRTKNEVRGTTPAPLGAVIGEVIPRGSPGAPPSGRRVVEGAGARGSPGWEVDSSAARLDEMTDAQREEARRARDDLKQRLRESPHRP